MKRVIRGAMISLALLTAFTDASAQAKLSESEALAIATDAYVFGYPLVLMDTTRQVMTAVAKSEGKKAPMNQLGHLREFPDDTFTDVVSPNADTLYSLAWLDLTTEPQVLSVPAVGPRYYLMQMMDAWTNVFAAPGSRTTGSGKGAYAIIGPRWKGKLPAGVKQIKAPTNWVWIIGRTQTNGKNDYAAVHAIQDQFALRPLSAWGKDYTPPVDVPVQADIDVNMSPSYLVAQMNAEQFFSRLNVLMIKNPPAARDAAAMKRFAGIGIEPGKFINMRAMDPALVAGLEGGVRDGQAKILAAAKQPAGKHINGWDVLPSNTANFGTDYLWRAVVANVGLGANLPADAVYPHATVDSQGQPLNGANRYTIRFAKGQLPPVKGFWSITMYDAKQAFVRNPIDRYAIGDRDKLTFNPDGSLTIFIQHDSPGADKASNWLPAPADAFNLFMRLYWPKRPVLDGTWKPPPVERAS